MNFLKPMSGLMGALVNRAPQMTAPLSGLAGGGLGRLAGGIAEVPTGGPPHAPGVIGPVGSTPISDPQAGAPSGAPAPQGGHASPFGGLIASMTANGGIPPGPGQGLWSKPAQPTEGKNSSQPPAQGPPGDGTLPTFGPQFGAPPEPPPPPPPLPAPPPNPHTQTPEAAKRWQNGQMVQQAYANNWNPNPVLLRAALGR